MKFEIGDELICIDGNFNNVKSNYEGPFPKEGEIYIYDGKCKYSPEGIYLSGFDAIRPVILQDVKSGEIISTGARISFHQRRFVKLDVLSSKEVASIQKEKVNVEEHVLEEIM